MKMKKGAALDVELSAVGFGCWEAGGTIVWNNADDAVTIRTIQHAVDLGINFFDDGSACPDFGDLRGADRRPGRAERCCRRCGR
jgi:aryl-alcohol dehydrogenase-like predicted oxidoreductase